MGDVDVCTPHRLAQWGVSPLGCPGGLRALPLAHASSGKQRGPGFRRCRALFLCIIHAGMFGNFSASVAWDMTGELSAFPKSRKDLTVTCTCYKRVFKVTSLWLCKEGRKLYVRRQWSLCSFKVAGMLSSGIKTTSQNLPGRGACIWDQLTQSHFTQGKKNIFNIIDTLVICIVLRTCVFQVIITFIVWVIHWSA